MTTPPLHTCGKKMVPCVFGFPNDDTMQMARRGEIKLMGCIVRDRNPPSHWCPYCKTYHREQAHDPD